MNRRVRVKPSKGQSMAGFFMGLIFCFIGLFVVVPSFGPFGLVWTLFAIIITVMNGLNAFSDKGVASHEITIEEDVTQDYVTHDNVEYGKSSEDRMNELQGLYDKGMITEEEYQKKRSQILEDI